MMHDTKKKNYTRYVLQVNNYDSCSLHLKKKIVEGIILEFHNTQNNRKNFFIK